MTDKEQLIAEKDNDICINTDKIIYTMKPKDTFDEGYIPTLRVTKDEGLSIEVGGYVITLPIKSWFMLGKEFLEKQIIISR